MEEAPGKAMKHYMEEYMEGIRSINEMDRDAYLLTNEVADIMRVSANTLQTWRMQGVGPRYAKFGRLVRYKAGDIADYMEKQAIQTSQGAELA